jgi:dCMP deaminase
MNKNKLNSWQKKWFQVADLVSTWSKDPSTKVGAVIIPMETDCPIIGWNGFPRGVTDSEERYRDREQKYNLVCHAEANAIINAAKNGVKISGGTLYVTHPPCNECAKLIVQSGISSVFYKKQPKELMDRWEKWIKFSKIILSEGGVGLNEV